MQQNNLFYTFISQKNREEGILTLFKTKTIMFDHCLAPFVDDEFYHKKKKENDILEEANLRVIEVQVFLSDFDKKQNIVTNVIVSADYFENNKIENAIDYEKAKKDKSIVLEYKTID